MSLEADSNGFCGLDAKQAQIRPDSQNEAANCTCSTYDIPIYCVKHIFYTIYG